jgi:hypothetical protein
MKFILAASPFALGTVATTLALTAGACSSSSNPSEPVDASTSTPDATSIAMDASPDSLPPAADASTSCTSSARAAIWAQMDHASIVPPNHGALLDLNPSDAGLTLDGATEILCQGMLVPNQFGDDAGVAEWGAEEEVWLHYDTTTDVGNFMVLWGGYSGTLTFKSPDGQSTYAATLDGHLTKDGQPFAVLPSAVDGGADADASDDAGGDAGAAIDADAADELYRGLVSTFAPTVAIDPAGTSCVSTHKCVVGGADGTTTIGYVFVPVLGLAIWFDTPPDTVVGRIDLYRVP